MPNATLKPANGRQYPLFAEVTINVANMNETTVPVPAIKLPYGAQVIGGAVITQTGFDAATATLAVGDATLGTRYVSAANIAVPGRVALVPTGFVSDGADLVVTPTFADPVTVGVVRVQIEYVIAGRAQEVQTN
jgi:hypothetical protein